MEKKPMASGDPLDSHWSSVEITAAIRALTDADWFRLKKIAGYYCSSRTIDADEILQEALTRVIAGDRSCQRHVGIVEFLAGVMRSIASDAMKSKKRRDATEHDPLSTLRLLPRSSEDDQAGEIPDDAPSPEDKLASHQETVRIKAAFITLFSDDLEAQTMIEGIMEDMDGEDLRALTELDKTAFASKRRLIRRRIDKAYPDGWTP